MQEATLREGCHKSHTQVGSSSTQKHQTSLKKLVRVKHQLIFATQRQKSFMTLRPEKCRRLLLERDTIRVTLRLGYLYLQTLDQPEKTGQAQTLQLFCDSETKKFYDIETSKMYEATLREGCHQSHTPVGSSSAHKHYTSLKKLVRDEHSSLFLRRRDKKVL